MAIFNIDGGIKQEVDKANAAATTFTLGARSTGFMSLASGINPLTGVAFADGDIVPYVVAIDDLREQGWGALGGSKTTITRNPITTISTGTRSTGVSATKLDFSGATANPILVVDITSFVAAGLLNAAFVAPGVRPTLEQGVPVSATDQVAKTTIFFEPVNGGALSLYLDAAGMVPALVNIPPSTISLALGTLASATIPNDLFLDVTTTPGTITATKVPWASVSARATALQSIKGTQYKGGDARFLYAGCFAPTSTTTAEDSLRRRLLQPAYNRIERACSVSYATSHTYATNTTRQMNSVATNQIEFMLSEALALVIAIKASTGDSGSATAGVVTADTTFGTTSFALDSTTTEDLTVSVPISFASTQLGNVGTVQIAAGSHFVSMNERSGFSLSVTYCPFSNACTLTTRVPC